MKKPHCLLLPNLSIILFRRKVELVRGRRTWCRISPSAGTQCGTKWSLRSTVGRSISNNSNLTDATAGEAGSGHTICAVLIAGLSLLLGAQTLPQTELFQNYFFPSPLQWRPPSHSPSICVWRWSRSTSEPSSSAWDVSSRVEPR